MVTVIATVICQPGHRADFLREFYAIVPLVREEEGCVEYGPTVDIATDIPAQDTDENRVTICEKWESVDALKAHLVAPHMQSYRPKIKDLVASVELRVLEAA